VRNAALQRGIAPLKDPTEMGLLLENLAASHLHALAQQEQVRLYHWREGDNEVDLVYHHPERPLAFEISLSASHGRRGLRAFLERYPRFRGRAFFIAPNAVAELPAADGIGSLPLDLLLLAVGRQADRALQRRLA
jgi:predicted AAA+ superfamily ATPase